MERKQREIIRGHVKRAVLIDLAAGDLSLAAIGAKYGVSGQAILHHRDANLEEIAEIKAHITEGVRKEVAGLWIADKSARIAAYEYQMDLLAEQLEDGSLEPSDFRGAMKVQQQALRNVAEELGDLKVQVEQGGELRFTVRGVDIEDLK
jgi:hypothetical protein